MKQTKFKWKWIVSMVTLTLFTSSGWALENAEEATDACQLQEIVVTATRQETPKQDVAADITVIDREAIERMPAATAGEVLQYIPGVSIESNGGPGAMTTARIQGSETRHVAVYVDGVPLNMLANPLTDLTYLPVDTIERIEVYKGAASSAWGSSLGGVINIITKDPDPDKPLAANIRSSYGKAGTSKNSGNISGTQGRLGYFLSLTRDQSSGFIDNASYDQTAVYGKLNYDIGEASRLNFVCSNDNGHNEDPLLIYPDFWDDIHQNRSYQRLLFESAYSNKLKFSVEGRHHNFDAKVEDVFTDHREIYNDYDESNWGGSVKVNYAPNSAHSVNLGADSDWGRFDWINYTQKYDTRNSAIYANDTFTHDHLSLNGGLRYDDNRDFGSATSPSLGAVYRIFEDQALIRAQVARGFSAPPAAWVKDPVYGTENLNPETALNYQLGSEIRFLKFFKFEANLFYADVKDLIRYDPDTRKFENIDKVTRKGVEGILSAAFACGLDLSFASTFTEVKDKTTHEEIKDIPTEQYQASAAYTWRWMTHSILGKYTDYNSTYPETRDKKFVFDYLFKARLPKVKYLDRSELFCAVYNLFNTNTVYRSVWPQPDRWMEAGIQFSL
ncbi:MAG: TonB-dependent receptor plug domain-containing protein [Desulfobacteraceae bacterium]|nr:TonB-dependent receptor plug domain-containing protein [Desulfobacteraceae bacterium]